jgi:hypothetical protein
MANQCLHEEVWLRSDPEIAGSDTHLLSAMPKLSLSGAQIVDRSCSSHSVERENVTTRNVSRTIGYLLHIARYAAAT